ncbi:hypothetical protein YC2023_011308 [Brassica napus]
MALDQYSDGPLICDQTLLASPLMSHGSSSHMALPYPAFASVHEQLRNNAENFFSHLSDSLEDLLDVMAVGNPVMQRMLSERRAALGLPVRDPQESDPTCEQRSNPTDYFEDM